MNRLKELIVRNKKSLIAATAFLAAYLFFQFAYPYHLIRREQMTLFLYDWDYIFQTYRETGWLAAFISDFMEQFFFLPAVGPLVVALLVTTIAVVTYRICRKALTPRLSMVLSALMFVWSFLRETDNLYITRYTVVMLGYLILVLAVLSVKKVLSRIIVACAALVLGIWTLGTPFHKYYGRAWGIPQIGYDRVIGLDSEVARERWDEVLKLSQKDLYMVEASYCYNLAHAMKGDMGQALFEHSQGNETSLLLRVSTERSIFSNTLAGEAWFHLGCMTIAEQSAIIALQASPKHTGARYILRLAQVNLISGQDASAMKYLNLLSKTAFYRKWALSMMPGNQSQAVASGLAQVRSKLAQTDFVHHSNEIPAILHGLLEANPTNILARNYLLCYDLMSYDLDGFMEDYNPWPVNAHIYQEAVLIWLSQNNLLSEQNAARYGIENATLKRMESFMRVPERHKNTYWYYYTNELDDNGQ